MDALEERDERNGQVSGAKVKEILESFQSEILSGVDSRLQTIHDSGLLGRSQEPQEVIFDPVEGKIPTFCDGKYPAFYYAEERSNDCKFWQVPRDFKFPKVNRRTG